MTKHRRKIQYVNLYQVGRRIESSGMYDTYKEAKDQLVQENIIITVGYKVAVEY
jgi:hypothetical protein